MWKINSDKSDPSLTSSHWLQPDLDAPGCCWSSDDWYFNVLTSQIWSLCINHYSSGLIPVSDFHSNMGKSIPRCPITVGLMYCYSIGNKLLSSGVLRNTVFYPVYCIRAPCILSCNSMTWYTVFEVSDQIFLLFEGFSNSFTQFWETFVQSWFKSLLLLCLDID